VEVVASLSQGRTAAAQCGLFTHKSVPVIFEPPCNVDFVFTLDQTDVSFICCIKVIFNIMNLYLFLKCIRKTKTSTAYPPPLFQSPKLRHSHTFGHVSVNLCCCLTNMIRKCSGDT